MTDLQICQFLLQKIYSPNNDIIIYHFIVYVILKNFKIQHSVAFAVLHSCYHTALVNSNAVFMADA